MDTLNDSASAGAQLAHSHVRPDRHLELAGRDGIAMWVVGWIAERLANALFQHLGNDVFEPVSLIMHLVPGKPEFFMQEGLQETVVADDFQRSLLALHRERHAAVFLIINQRRFCSSQPLDHTGGGGRRYVHLPSNLVRRSTLLLLG